MLIWDSSPLLHCKYVVKTWYRKKPQIRNKNKRRARIFKRKKLGKKRMWTEANNKVITKIYIRELVCIFFSLKNFAIAYKGKVTVTITTVFRTNRSRCSTNHYRYLFIQVYWRLCLFSRVCVYESNSSSVCVTCNAIRSGKRKCHSAISLPSPLFWMNITNKPTYESFRTIIVH